MTDPVTIVLWALLVGNALRPPRLGGRAGFVVYVLSMTINELPSAREWWHMPSRRSSRGSGRTA